jgi:hypothetical protein
VASWVGDSVEGGDRCGTEDAGSRPARRLWAAAAPQLRGTTLRADDGRPEGGGGTKCSGSSSSAKSKMVQSEEAEATIGRAVKD